MLAMTSRLTRLGLYIRTLQRTLIKGTALRTLPCCIRLYRVLLPVLVWPQLKAVHRG